MIVHSSKRQGRRRTSLLSSLARFLRRANSTPLFLVVFLFSTLCSFSVHPKGVPEISHVVQEEARELFESSTTKRSKILMVSYIFGSSKRYVQMFCESARYSGIDVVIIGSPPPSFPLPPNVRHFPLTWNEFCLVVSLRLFGGRERLKDLVRANRAKINDFKPMFAYLFPNLIKGYDWWGHVDNDMVLGNVRTMIPELMLANYDVITPLPPSDGFIRTWGPFTLYRNSNTTNQLFQYASHSLIELVDSYKLFVLDEGGRMGRSPGLSEYWNSSISGILTNHHEELGIRVSSQALPFQWDGNCNTDEPNCAECRFVRSKQWQKLTATSSHTNCTKDAELCEEEEEEEVLLCHYQRGKANLEKSLRRLRNRKLTQDGRFRVSFLEGFRRF